MGQGDTIVITVDGKEVARMKIPEREHFLEHSDRVFTIDIDGKKLADALSRWITVDGGY